MTTPKTPNTSELIERLEEAAPYSQNWERGEHQSASNTVEYKAAQALRQAASTITRLEGERDEAERRWRSATERAGDLEAENARLQAEVVEGRGELKRCARLLKAWRELRPEDTTTEVDAAIHQAAAFLSRPVGVGKEEELESAQAKSDRLCGAPTETEAGKYLALPLVEDARQRWRERQEDCAQYGADISMPKIEVPVDVLVGAFDALNKIERWFGEFPSTGKTWDDGSPMSFATLFGSNGERDFMREIARAAIAKASAHHASEGGE